MQLQMMIQPFENHLCSRDIKTTWKKGMMQDWKYTMYYLTVRSNERRAASEDEATVLAAILPSRVRRLEGPVFGPSIMDTLENRSRLERTSAIQKLKLLGSSTGSGPYVWLRRCTTHGAVPLRSLLRKE